MGTLRCVVRTTDLGLGAWWGSDPRVRQAQGPWTLGVKSSGIEQPLGAPTEVWGVSRPPPQHACYKRCGFVAPKPCRLALPPFRSPFLS